jgi:hypothetical protein
MVYLLVIAMTATSALAASKTQNGVTLHYPDSFESCTPSSKIRTSELPESWKVVYQFYHVKSLSDVVSLGSGTVWGTLDKSFPYPDIEGTMTFAVNITVFNGDGLRVVKLAGKWTVKCEKTPPPPPPPPPSGSEGCTPGYWRQSQHFDSWSGYDPTDDFETVFDVDASFDPHTLLDAVRLGGGGEYALARHAVAALLNAASSGVDYEYSVSEVKDMVQEAYETGNFEHLKDLFVDQNEAGCPLN